jgi:hypothetical protein|tara:strand:- start:2484 stop:3125 length:642 start_codon:yes stop_codon:yes gene_type:complete
MRCQRYTSFTSKGIKVPGEDLSIEDFSKVLDFFNHINFCGQVSDPVHHPKFTEFLKMIYERKDHTCSIHHASAAKPLKWYPTAFQANPRAQWWFGIDGFPKDSHKYRTNQDGVKLFDIMKDSVKYLKNLPIWQYIVFNFNENDIEACRDMATEIGVKFIVINSSRWMGINDPLRPTKKNLSLDRTQGSRDVSKQLLHETIFMNDKDLSDKKRK